MPTRRINHALQHGDELPPLPLDQVTWQAIAKTLAFSPQQTRIVELILRGRQDKEIATELSLSIPTVRTYLKRIFDRIDVSDRLSLVLRIFSMAQELTSSGTCRCH